ncbi:MAG: diaminopimelate epimerase [Pyrinomonadaceae bacterium]
MAINFCKFHGFGNDYIIFEAEELKDVSDALDFAARVCNRNTGIGGDGIAVLEKLLNEPADYSCRIINSDGSEASFSGNGTRCAVAYLYYKKLWDARNLRLQTISGLKNYELLKQENLTYWFRAELGKPKFELPKSPLSETIRIDANSFSLVLPEIGGICGLFFVDVGNPVVCVFVEDFEAWNWRKIGRAIERATEVFPERTNVTFVKTIDAENIGIRIWERGAGETSSSGTCSIAAAVAHLQRENLRGQVSVHAVGGMTEAVWREDGEMLITGRADLAFCGEYLAEARA